MSDLIGKSFGRYHILEQLGEGGMATVFKAFDTRLETDVAVKIIRTENILPSTLERALKRFEREAKSLARLTHPNIVKVTDFGEYEGKPYLVMPYLPGGTLKKRMGKPIPWQEAVQLLLPIAEALDYSHTQNMIHRDVKPANILLTESGQPMLTDFGIAKVLDVEETMELTGTSAAIGTPEYMAPEQATAKTVDHRADIYAFGVVLYEMVTGRKPYTADTPMAILIMHARDPLPSPKKVVPGLPDGVEKVLLKALAKKPEDRYQSMKEMVVGLEKVLGSSKTSVKSLDAADKALRDKTKRDALEKARNENAERRAIRKVEFTKTLSKSFNILKSALVRSKAFFRISGVAGIVILVLWGGSLAMPQLRSLMPAAKPAATITRTPSPVPPTRTLIPLPTKTKSPTSTPLGGGDGKIIFLSGVYEKDQWNVFSINANGTGLKQLTFKNTTIWYPVWSPDGNKIALTIKENEFFQLYVMNADGSGLTKISGDDKKNYNTPAWSPDGTRLAFSSQQSNGTEDIFLINTDGTNEIKLTSQSRNDVSPSWSPDGKKIVYVSDRSGFSEVYVMNADGSNQAALTSLKAAVMDPRWSPDGKYIVFASTKDQELWEIYIMKSDGTDVVRLTNNDTWDLRPKFTPDGTKISWDSCCFNLSTMNLDGSGVVKLYTEFEWAHDWKP